MKTEYETWQLKLDTFPNVQLGMPISTVFESPPSVPVVDQFLRNIILSIAAERSRLGRVISCGDVQRYLLI